MKEICEVSICGGAVAVVSGAGGAAGASGTSGFSSLVFAGTFVFVPPGAPPGFPPGPRSRPAWAFGSSFAASAAALAASSAALRRYSDTGSPVRSLSRLSASTFQRESTLWRLTPRYTIVSAPNQTVSRFSSSSEMPMTAGVRVNFTRDSESVYSIRPARANTFLVVSSTSTCPRSSTSFSARW